MEVGTGLLPAVSARGGATIASCPRTARTRRPPPPALTYSPRRPIQMATTPASSATTPSPPPPPVAALLASRTAPPDDAPPPSPGAPDGPSDRQRAIDRFLARAELANVSRAPSSARPCPYPVPGCVGAARRVGVTCGASASGFYCPFMRVLYIPRLDARVGRRRAGVSCPGLRIGGDAPGTPIRPSVLPAPLRTRSRD
jgi:hypothetical protein